MDEEKLCIKSEDGFTLVEVILSIIILSIVILLIFNFMDFGIKTFTFGADMVDENANLRLSALKMTNKLRNAFDVEVTDTLPSGDQKQYFYCDTSNETLVYNDNGTEYQFSGNSDITSATFQIKEKTINEVDGAGNITAVVSIGYLLVFDIQGNNTSLTTEVLLNNVSGGTVTSDLNASKIYVGFNHDIP